MKTNKQIDGIRHEVLETKVQLVTRVEQSKLPIQSILNGNHDSSKQMNYQIDERNPKLVLSIHYADRTSDKPLRKELVFRKSVAADLFSTLEKIQDDLNSYM